ncbi:MAG: OmpH family outer membrane protein [bacterium]|nr:OmpH family outer membrane protein [bacterium]
MARHIAWMFGIFFWASLVLLPGTMSQAEAETKIGIVKVRVVWLRSKAGQRVRDEIEKEKNRMKKDIEQKRESLRAEVQKMRAMQVEIDQKSAIWRESERGRKSQELRQIQRGIARGQDELKRLIQESERDLTERQRAMFAKIVNEVRDVVTEIGKENKYDFIVDSQLGGVVYSSKAVDLTDLVIERYDRKK